MEVQETAHNQLVLSHQVVEGLAEQSYGLHVAAIAGCPENVLCRAKQLIHSTVEQPTALLDKIRWKCRERNATDPLVVLQEIEKLLM